MDFSHENKIGTKTSIDCHAREKEEKKKKKKKRQVMLDQGRGKHRKECIGRFHRRRQVRWTYSTSTIHPRKLWEFNCRTCSYYFLASFVSAIDISQLVCLHLSDDILVLVTDSVQSHVALFKARKCHV